VSSQTAGYNDTSSLRPAGIGFGRRNDYLLLIVNAACEAACSPVLARSRSISIGRQ